MPKALQTGAVALIFAALWACSPTARLEAQTFLVSEVGLTGAESAVATGVNRSNQVSGFSLGLDGVVRGWTSSVDGVAIDLGSFGGSETRALSLNDSGDVVGYSIDLQGQARGFVWRGGTLDVIPSLGLESSDLFPQHINATGKVTGFASVSGKDEQPFLWTPPKGLIISNSVSAPSSPVTAAAYGLNDLGRFVGIASWSDGFNRAFRSTPTNSLEDLGTLGGDESWAYAVNRAGQIVGSASAITGDTHAFLFSDAAGMQDLGTLGGYISQAFALNEQGDVVGSAEKGDRKVHAFLWSKVGGMRDLNDYISADAGWELIEARGINDGGTIVGNGLFHGRPRAFMLAPFLSVDTQPPVALLQAHDLTNLLYSAYLFDVVFWDRTGVAAASIATNGIRVTGPNGFDQAAHPYGVPSPAEGRRIVASFYVAPTNGIWNGTNNGTYTVSLEADTVRDVLGNVMSGGTIGTFRVATETQPLAQLTPNGSPLMEQSSPFTLTALGSFPYASTDVFAVTIDWENDGKSLQTLTGTNGLQVTHTFSSIGLHTIRMSVVDPHGIASRETFTSVLAANPPPSNLWVGAAPLTGSRRLAIGLRSGDDLVCLGGLPLKSGVLQAQTFSPGAATFVDGRRLSAQTIGMGAGIDALNRLVIYGGIEPNAATPNLNGYVYSPTAGVGSAIARKRLAVHDFAFCEDDQRRLYSMGGATGSDTTSGTAAVERFDGVANTWTTLAPMPAPRIGATACRDGLGNLLVIGGIDPVSGQQTSTMYVYRVANDSWSELAGVPSGGIGGRVAALGADGLVYLIGGVNAFGLSTSDVQIYDPAQNLWFSGPSLTTTRGTPAVALGSDGFLYVMGGDGPPKGGGGGGNNGLSTVERLDTKSPQSPRLLSTPMTDFRAGDSFNYRLIASGNPRPSFALVTSPEGMTIDAASGWVQWVTTTNQAGVYPILVRASNSVGVAEQNFELTIHPLPGDITPPTAPTNFFPAFRTATNVTFTWSGASDNIGVVSYNIYNFVGSRSRHWGLLKSGITNRSFIAFAGGFSPQFGVAAVDAAGNVSPLKTVSANTLTIPVVNHLLANEPSTVILGSSFLYTLSVAAVPAPGFSGVSGPAGITLSQIPGPDPLQDYAVVQWQPQAVHVGTNTFTVYATNANTSGGSRTFTVVVLPGGTDLVAPSPVAQLTASGISFDHCLLTWTPAGDNVGVVNYAIRAVHFAAPTNHVVTLNVPGKALEVALDGLLPASGYTVSITPSDAVGNSGASTSIFLTTQVRPNLPLRWTRGIDTGSWLLSWDAPSPGARFTVESADSISAPVWRPVEPIVQWPASVTQLTIVPSPEVLSRFYRVTQAP